MDGGAGGDSQAVLAPLQGHSLGWWQAVAAMALTVALFTLLAVWMFQPLARLRDRADTRRRSDGSPGSHALAACRR
ncbi:MAG: hypothetical protein R3E55_02215 [Burkholderiaceae bacterium]